MILVGVLAVLVTMLLIRFFHYQRVKLRLPIPGWERKSPDAKIGDLGAALANGSIFDYLWRQHGEGSIPVISFWWRDQRVVSVCSLQGFKDTQNLYNRPRLIYGPISEPLHGPNSIQSVNDEEWKERKKLLHGTVRGQKLLSFVSNFVQIADGIQTKWSTFLSAGEPVKLKKEMFLATLKAILSTSLGNIFSNDDEIEDLANTYDLCKRETDVRFLDIPSPDSPRELEFQKNLKHLNDCLRHMIKMQRKQIQELPLLDALLKSDATEDLILSDMVTFLGGFHTSAYYATWTFYYLAKYSEVQEKLYKEIKEKVGDDKNEKLKAYVNASDSYLRQVLDESMRVSTTANFTAHYSDEDIMVDGYCVPAKTPIIHALGVAMYNNAIWENPDKFNPDRFAPGSRHAKRGHEYRPFGVSNYRRCPANQFTYMMVSIYVTIILHCFVLRPDDGQDVEKVYGIATSPKSDPLIHLKLRHKE